MRSQLLLFLVLSLVQVLHGWRLPLPRTLLATNTRCGVAPSRAFHLYAIRRRMKSAAPVVQVGTPPCINEEITADPVRLIAPKVVPPPLIDESTVDEDSNEENDDDDDYDDSEEDVDDSEGEDEDAPKGFVSGEEMLGIYSLEDALQKAREFNLDLVMINDKADPPVCKIVNYGKYKYTIERRKKDNLKKQIRGDIKEVKMSYKIDTHDFDVRLRSAQRFIASGDRVRVTVQFRGREMQHKDLALSLLKRFLEPLSATATVESPAKVEGRQMFMLIAPKKTGKK